MPRKIIKAIESRFGLRITVALPVEYRQERVGRYNVPIPYYRYKLRGEQRWRLWRAA